MCHFNFQTQARKKVKENFFFSIAGMSLASGSDLSSTYIIPYVISSRLMVLNTIYVSTITHLFLSQYCFSVFSCITNIYQISLPSGLLVTSSSTYANLNPSAISSFIYIYLFCSISPAKEEERREGEK